MLVGEKTHCTFCGIAAPMKFRAKSGDNVMDQIGRAARLVRDQPLQGTGIFDYKFFTTPCRD